MIEFRNVVLEFAKVMFGFGEFIHVSAKVMLKFGEFVFKFGKIKFEMPKSESIL
jgi:hypothetical protein